MYLSNLEGKDEIITHIKQEDASLRKKINRLEAGTKALKKAFDKL
jgi:hypothetical protein